MFLRKKTNKKLKKGIVLSACFLILFSTTACGNNKSEISKTNQEKSANILDVRTADIVGQQQAILRFTTDNKAGSIISIKLEPVNKKYIYTLDAVDKKGLESIMTIDAKTSNVIKKEEKSTIDKNNMPGFIDFTPVLDVDKATKNAKNFTSNKDIDQVLAYTLYNDGNINIYEFTLTDGANENAKTEKVLINAVTGKKIDSAKSNNSNTESSSNKNDKK